jgi:hypothetical protein
MTGVGMVIGFFINNLTLLLSVHPGGGQPEGWWAFPFGEYAMAFWTIGSGVCGFLFGWLLSTPTREKTARD